MNLFKTINCINWLTNFDLRFRKINNSIFQLLFLQSGFKTLRLIFTKNLIFFRGCTIYIYNKVFDIRDYNNFIKKIEKLNKLYFYSSVNSFSKIHMVGIGFKNFVLGSELHILVGDCNYILLEIPEEIKIFCKKNQIFLLSHNAEKLYDFTNNIKKIKRPNLYKGKGILEFKNFKFTKLKVGKKQRYT